MRSIDDLNELTKNIIGCAIEVHRRPGQESTIMNIYSKELKRFEVPLPPLTNNVKSLIF